MNSSSNDQLTSPKGHSPRRKRIFCANAFEFINLSATSSGRGSSTIPALDQQHINNLLSQPMDEYISMGPADKISPKASPTVLSAPSVDFEPIRCYFGTDHTPLPTVDEAIK